jgi:hypothetical protein
VGAFRHASEISQVVTMSKEDNRIHAKAIWDARHGGKKIQPAPPCPPRKAGDIIERALQALHHGKNRTGKG